MLTDVVKTVFFFSQMMTLVNKYHSDLVSTTHVHLAHECESRGDYRAAENHFVNAGEWKLAVKMYRTLDMWEEAYKVITLGATTPIGPPYLRLLPQHESFAL